MKGIECIKAMVVHVQSKQRDGEAEVINKQILYKKKKRVKAIASRPLRSRHEL